TVRPGHRPGPGAVDDVPGRTVRRRRGPARGRRGASATEPPRRGDRVRPAQSRGRGAPASARAAGGAAAGHRPLPAATRAGRGGMGTVYEAEQDSPRRTVALKVIRPGLVAPELLKRFAREAQILGLLHHPGIAAIYEAALAQDGRPFFAMEL